MTRFRGMTWRHERGLNPLLEASKDFARSFPDVTIEWEARSLQDFEQYPLELLAEKYDLIMIDHPHIGAAVASCILLPLNDLLPADFLRDQEMQSVGQSFASYTWEGKQWALAADAAAQVSAYRPDLLRGFGQEVPRTWDEVLTIAQGLPNGTRIAMPLNPVHTYSSFFTLAAQIGGTPCWSDGSELAVDVGEEVLGLLEKLVPHLHRRSLYSDPIEISEHMATTDEIVYVPLMYGYSNYARTGFRPSALRFTNIPSGDGIPRGSMIGGVGLAISAYCKDPQTATAFVQLVTNGEYQRTAFFTNGGQPGHRSAWIDPDVNRLSNSFFEDTLRTLDLGSVRPRCNGYISFQEQAGQRVRNFLMGQGGSRTETIRALNRLFNEAHVEKM